MDKQTTGDSSSKKVCPTCGKRISHSSRPGSLTSYLFGAFECACSRAQVAPQTQPAPAGQNQIQSQENDVDFCPKCGLRIVDGSNVGSLTGFLFQDTRCKCLPNQAFAGGKMSDRFWKMKEAGSGTIFVSATPESDKSGAGAINLAAGATIGGAYQIIQLLGAGGMGEVYLARHATLGKKCALKVIPPEQVTEIGWLRFQLEAKAVAKLEHINLVRVTDLGIHEGCLPFYAMDYIEGKNLAEIVAQSGPLSLAATLEIFIQVCDGVDCAHRSGLLHRDLKPANIMVEKGERGKTTVKILDFGLAKLTSHDRSRQSLTAVGDVFGSPYYMSPEQCNGDKLDRRSDIYSLGCTMFECLTGQPPFTGHLAAAIFFGHLEGDPPALESIAGRGKFPAAMEVVMAKLLRKNPVERYQTLLELRSDLEKLARGEDVQPFYVNRGRPANSARAELETKQNDQEQNGSQKHSFRLASSLTFGLTVSILILVPALFIFHRPITGTHPISHSAAGQQKNNITGVLPKLPPLGETDSSDNSVAPTPEQVPGQSLNQTAPYSKEIERAGRRVTSFDFPHDFTLGTLYRRDKGLAVPARGHVEFPTGTILTLVPDPSLARYPQYLRRFRPGEITSISISLNAANNTLIKAISNMKGLKTLEVKACYAIDDKCISDLGKLDSLTELLVNYCGITGRGIARLPYLKKLTSINFNGGENAELLCKALAGSTALKTLWLDSCFLPPSAFQDLSKLPNLEQLMIDHTIVTDKELLALAQLPHLRLLFATHCNINVNQAAIIKKFPALESIKLGTDPIGSKTVLLLRKTLGDLVTN